MTLRWHPLSHTSALLVVGALILFAVACAGDESASAKSATAAPGNKVSTQSTAEQQVAETAIAVDPTAEPSQVAESTPTTAPIETVAISKPETVELAMGGDGVLQPLSNAPLADGWTETEYLFAGTARSWQAVGGVETALGADGVWPVEVVDTANYRTRMIVRLPDAEDFSGTVLVEWFNVTAGTDTSPDWGYLAEEIGRSGHGYVGVSVQAVGINGMGGDGRAGGLVDTRGLKAIDPQRYGSLEHPGDAYAFDILTHAGAVVSGLHSTDVLNGLVADQVLALGESQSAIHLATYINAIHPVTGLFDGFFVHSRGAGAPRPSVQGRLDPVLIREDVGVPVFQYEAETDLTALGFVAARQPDSEWVHTWEVAGTAHADAYSLSIMGGLPRQASLGSVIGCEVPINDGPHHETLQAGLSHLVAWVSTGITPPTSPLIEIDTSDQDNPVVVRDDLGIALGGIRTPPVDLPLRVLSGDPSGEAGGFCFLFGQTLAFDDGVAAELHGDVDSYLVALGEAAAEAVDAGWLLEPDAATMIAEETARAETVLTG